MAAYYIMTNYGPMSIQGLKRMSDDKINEILKDAPKDMDTFQEVYEKYSQLVDNIKNIDLSSKQDILTSAQLAVINGNYALDADLDVTKDAIFVEDENSQEMIARRNVLAVKEGNEKSEKIKDLIEVLTSDDVRTFIEEQYKGAVVPVF